MLRSGRALKDGYVDVPLGRLAAVVTYLEMTSPPELPPARGPECLIRRVESPDLDWYRRLYRAVGQEWLWFSRLRMTDEELSALIRHPSVAIGRGLGSQLMRHTLEQAWSRNPRRVYLHTCTLDHPSALQFYLKWGFRAYKRAVEVAHDPRLTGDSPASAAPQIPLIGPLSGKAAPIPTTGSCLPETEPRGRRS